jgi:hypothetical protein
MVASAIVVNLYSHYIHVHSSSSKISFNFQQICNSPISHLLSLSFHKYERKAKSYPLTLNIIATKPIIFVNRN